MNYTVYTNIDSMYVRTYEPGDRLVKGWSGVVAPNDVQDAANKVWWIHNRDDRPDGRMNPSLSVGDVIVLGEVAVSVADVGFTPVTIDAADVITDRTWREVVGTR